MHDIGWAVEAMWNGHKVSREGWNGKNQYIAIQLPIMDNTMTKPYVYIKTIQGDRIPWLCSQSDLLAKDWFFLDREVSVVTVNHLVGS